MELQQQLKTLKDEKEKAMTEISSLKESLDKQESGQNQLPDDILNLQRQLSEARNSLERKNDEITSLKIHTSSLSEQVEHEKETKAIFWNRMINTISEKTMLEKQYEEDTTSAAQDITQLKEHTINLTKDKHELWGKLDLIVSDLKQKNENRWVKDSEVTVCTNCKVPFTMMRRKHHCRLCGHIFCYECCNNWLDTPHSKSKIRACTVCAEVYTETHSRDVEDGGNGETIESSLAYVIQNGRESRSSSFDDQEN